MESLGLGGARFRDALRRGRRAALRALSMGALAFALAAAVGQPRARATVMVEVPLERLVREADVIVMGMVERVGSRLVVQTGGDIAPHTITTLRVSEWLKGRGDSRIHIDELGGVTELGGMSIAGTPEYAQGQEVIVFLRRTPEGALRTYAMVQGQFVVQRGAPGIGDVVVRDTSSVGFASWASGQMSIEHGGVRAMRLADFLGYVRDVIEQTGGEPSAPATGDDASHETVGGAR